MFSVLKDVFCRRELLGIFVGRNLKIRYKSSALGFFWSLIVPIFLIAIYAVFLKVIRFPMELPILVTGVIVWQFFSMCLGDALHAIVGNANLVTKSAFPRLILPTSMVLANLVNFLLSCVVLLGYLLIVGVDFGPVLWIPLIVLSQVALCLGLSLLFCASNVFFRDTEHIQSMVMLAWFFMTPVIYPIGLVMDEPAFAPWMKAAFFVNPMTGVVTGYRMALLSFENPGSAFLCLSFAMCWLILVIGFVVFQKVEGLFADAL
jgi:ABC-type polysaccharide/polyol phosphate export permease